MSHSLSTRPLNIEGLHLCAPEPSSCCSVLLITYCSNCTRTWPIKYELGVNASSKEWESCPGCGHKCLPEWYCYKGEERSKDISSVDHSGANTSKACNGKCDNDDDSGKKYRTHASRECRFILYTSNWRCWACGTGLNWAETKPCGNCGYWRDTACVIEWNCDKNPALVLDYNYGTNDLVSHGPGPENVTDVKGILWRRYDDRELDHTDWDSESEENEE